MRLIIALYVLLLLSFTIPFTCQHSDHRDDGSKVSSPTPEVVSADEAKKIYETLSVPYSKFDKTVTSLMSREEWYRQMKMFYSHQRASIASMIFSHDQGEWESSTTVATVNSQDVDESIRFLHDFFPDAGKSKRKGLDLGAGIGRVVKDVFFRLVGSVDLVEQDSKFLWEARRRLYGHNRYGKYVLGSVTNYTFSEAIDNEGNPISATEAERLMSEPRYDLISLVGMGEALLDDELLQVLQRHQKLLSPNGVFFLKDVVLPRPSDSSGGTSTGQTEALEQNSEVVVKPLGSNQNLDPNQAVEVSKSGNQLPSYFQRSQYHYLQLLSKAVGWNIVKQEVYDLPIAEVKLRVVSFALTTSPVAKIQLTETASPYSIMGWDLSEGVHYPSLEVMWAQMESQLKWKQYNKEYWDTREAKNNNNEIAERDILESVQFLTSLYDTSTRYQRKALDVGAGVGRVAQAVLLKAVYTVDLLDQGRHFLIEAKNRLYAMNPKARYIHSSVQDYKPEVLHEYDLVCVQYTALYLNDVDFVEILLKLKSVIKWDRKSYLFIKEPISKYEQKFQINHDSGLNIVRTMTHFEWLLTAKGGWRIVRKEVQKDWVPEGNPIWMYAVQPLEVELGILPPSTRDEL